MKLVVESITPGTMNFPSGEPRPRKHSIRARGEVEGDRCRPCLQQLDNLTQGNVVVVRTFVVAPAEMEAHALGRDVFGRRVEYLEMQVDDLRNSASVSDRNCPFQPEPRSGQSSTHVKPASVIALYSSLRTSARAQRYSSS